MPAPAPKIMIELLVYRTNSSELPRLTTVPPIFFAIIRKIGVSSAQ
jgi:hypothetical protein